MGDAVYVPYLTVEDGQDSLISVSNHADKASYARVIISEADNGQSTLYFDVFLPSNSTWSAALVDVDGEARLLPNSTICTLPAIPAQGVALRNFNYANHFADGGSTELVRARTGALEVLERGTLDGQLSDFTNAKNCSGLLQAYLDFPNNPRNGQIGAPAAAIEASVQIVSVNEGRIFAVPGVAIEGFAGQARTELKIAEPIDRIFTPIAAEGAQHFFVEGPFGRLRFSADRGADAISSLFMTESTRGEVYTSSGLGASTTWVLSFPTKAAYVSAQPGSLAQGSNAEAPFANYFGAAGSCEGFLHEARDFDGKQRPLAQSAVSSGLCGQVNKLSFRASDEGVALIRFDESETRTIQAVRVGEVEEDVTLRGLPVLGIRLGSFVNREVTPGVLANYTFADRLRGKQASVEVND